MEDKFVQRAVVMILERIYEVDSCDTSFGFRPGRSRHQALSVLGQIIGRGKGGTGSLLRLLTLPEGGELTTHTERPAM